MTLLFDISSITPTTGGGGANLTTLDITPMTSAQSITPDEGYDGFSLVNVSAVNASIDPNITASNIKQGVDILGVTGTAATGGIGAVGNYTVVNGVAMTQDGNIAGKFDGITEVAVNGMKNAFYSWGILNTSADFPDLTIIANNGMWNTFEYCYNLPGINFPKLYSVGDNGMQNCFRATKITSAIFPNLSSIQNNAMAWCFTGCDRLVTAEFSSLTETSYQGFMNGFYGCQNNLTTISFPNLVTVGNSSFYALANGCWNLTNVYLPNVKTINSYGMYDAFGRCYNLPSLNLYNVTYIGDGGAQGICLQASNLTEFNLDNVTYVGVNGLARAFGATNVVYANFASLTNCGNMAFNLCFSGCNSLISIDFSVFNGGTEGSYMGGTMMNLCPSSTVQSINFPMLSGVKTGMFNGAFLNCKNLQSVDFSNITYVNGYGFNRAFSYSGIPSVTFTNLETITSCGFNQSFTYCPNLTTLSFPKLTTVYHTNAFQSMLFQCNNVTVHFPSALQATIGTWADVVNGFSGTNTTVLFDL